MRSDFKHKTRDDGSLMMIGFAVEDLPICSPWTFRENHSPNIIYTVNRRNQPTAMDLYFLDWVRTRYKTKPETHTKSAHTVLSPSGRRYELGPRGQLGWGSGLALAIWVGLGRVGQKVKKNNLRSRDDVWTVVLSESPWTANRRSPQSREFEFKNVKVYVGQWGSYQGSPPHVRAFVALLTEAT